MIDLNKATKEFDDYVKKYDFNNRHIKGKHLHTYRVMDYCKEIAQSLNLNEEETKLAQIIGLLHDIARFEQQAKYNTFSDLKSFDHGDYGAKILKENDFIRKFIEDNSYDEIILKAITNHNKYKIEDGLSQEQILFSKIIRDADKLDIYYETLEFFYNENDVEKIENGMIEDYIMNQIIEQKQVKKGISDQKINNVLITLAFVFDINFEYSFKVLKEKDYINKIVDKFNFKNEETKAKMEEVREEINKYLENRG